MLTRQQFIALQATADTGRAVVMLDDLRAVLAECIELRAALQLSTNQLALYVEGDANTATAQMVREHRSMLKWRDFSNGLETRRAD